MKRLIALLVIGFLEASAMAVTPQPPIITSDWVIVGSSATITDTTDSHNGTVVLQTFVESRAQLTQNKAALLAQKAMLDSQYATQSANLNNQIFSRSAALLDSRLGQ